MSKLTLEQRNKVKEFIQKLHENPAENLLDRKQFEEYIHKNMDDIIENALSYGFNNPRTIAKIRNPIDLSSILACDAKTFKHADLEVYTNILADLIEQETIDRTINGFGANETKKSKKKVIKESNTYTMISALREIVDDLLLSTELLIDNKYGRVDHKEFKDAWYKSSNEFEKKFRNIVKNLIKSRD